MSSDPLISGYLSLSRDINKSSDTYSDEREEGVISELTEELKLSLSDEDLIDLKKDWESAWEPIRLTLSKSQEDNEEYWLGKQYEGQSAQEGHALIDNLIFESLETFLPIATRPKADPVVTGDNTKEGEELADKVRKMITYWGDTTQYNLKMKQVVRYWALYKLGCVKLGWSINKNDITAVAIRPQKLILDPDATIEAGEYTGEYIGEYRKESARNLMKRFPKAKDYIEEQCKGKYGTKMQYIEWWTDEYVFWTMNDEVLAKAKNPHWNYNSSKKITGDDGTESQEDVSGKNHFPYPKKPYAFLSVFSLGLRPYDETNLIQQSLPLQDLVNKRLRQIDRNADNIANGATAVSGDSYTKEQASGVANARRKGGVIYVPTGNVQNAVMDLQGQALPAFVYESLNDYRNRLRDIFGVRGSTAQGTIQDKTVRGKLQIKGQDSDRIGGGVSTFLETLSNVVYNYAVQMMYVYYNEPHVATLIGKNRSAEYTSLRSADLVSKLSVSVKDGSMIPKDPVSEREEAVNLWQAGAIGPISFFEKLDFPDPKEAAEELYMWKSDPALLFPEIAAKQAQMAQGQQQQVKKPSETLNYKDAPDDIKRQIEQQAGLQPSQMPETDPTHEKLVAQGLQHSHDAHLQQDQQTHAHQLEAQKANNAMTQQQVDLQAQAEQAKQAQANQPTT